MIDLDFSRCRKVWVFDDSEVGGFWNPPPEHVKEGVRAIVAHPYFLLATEMGGMKSAQAIIAAQFLHDAGIIDRVIVIAPASVRSTIWFDEGLSQLREQVFNDKRNVVSEYHQKVKQWSHGPKDAKELRWIVTNYEYIRSHHLKTLIPYCGPKTLLVLDESSAVRTWSSAQTKACMKLRWLTNRKGFVIQGAARCGRVLLLNGTPVAESPLDMFSQGNMMHPSILACPYVTHYKARYAIQTIVRGSGGQALMNPRTGKPLEAVESWTNLDDLQRRFAPYVLRREAKDFGVDFALPPVGFDVPLTEETWKHYKAMRDEMVIWLKSGVATAATAAVKSIRLSQITSGFVGGIEDPNVGPYQTGDTLDLPGSFLDGVTLQQGGAESLNQQSEHFRNASPIQWVGREKLDFALAFQASLLARYPDLKLLTWCRFVPELRRYLLEVDSKFQHPIGAACGAKVFEGEHSQKSEREMALRLLHPKTAPAGPATVGATQGTGALGLNFTACRTVLDMSYDFSPWKKKQGDSRVNRPGQTGPVSFFYLVATGPKGQKTIDHHVMMTRLGKMNVNDLTVAAWVKVLEEE